MAILLNKFELVIVILPVLLGFGNILISLVFSKSSVPNVVLVSVIVNVPIFSELKG